MTLCSIIVPIANYHAAIAQRAIASAEAQTVPCTVIPVIDSEGRGAGWARNRGAAQSQTPFVTFLDADDTLHPEFVERCAQAYVEYSYMYTDWQPAGEGAIVLPDRTNLPGWHDKRFHLVTTLLPRQLFDAVGGFDETIPALEDTALYLKLNSMGVCGVRVPFTGVTYNYHMGQRGANAHRAGDYTRLMASFRQMYGRIAMGCGCGDIGGVEVQGAKQEGDVAVTVLLNGNKTLIGLPGNTRRYRGGNGKATWMALEDAMRYIQHDPRAFKLVDQQRAAKGASPSRADVLAALAKVTE